MTVNLTDLQRRLLALHIVRARIWSSLRAWKHLANDELPDDLGFDVVTITEAFLVGQLYVFMEAWNANSGSEFIDFKKRPEVRRLIKPIAQAAKAFTDQRHSLYNHSSHSRRDSSFTFHADHSGEDKPCGTSEDRYFTGLLCVAACDLALTFFSSDFEEARRYARQVEMDGIPEEDDEWVKRAEDRAQQHVQEALGSQGTIKAPP